jgi:hypothetical protein
VVERVVVERVVVERVVVGLAKVGEGGGRGGGGRSIMVIEMNYHVSAADTRVSWRPFPGSVPCSFRLSHANWSHVVSSSHCKRVP